MKRGLLQIATVALVTVELAMIASAATYGPYPRGSVSVTASGSPACTVSLAETTVSGVRDGDVVLIQISYDLHAPGWFDEADVYLWFAGEPQEHAGTTDYYSGTLTIHRTVSPNQIYSYYAQGVGYDWGGSITCSNTYEEQLFTYA